jgi:cyclic beta-1,2-glucan synthetase
MNRVGDKGEGESVWMAWFLAATLRAFEPLALARGDQDRAARCSAEVARLAEAVDVGAWDGAWYRRAYFDDGTPLGSRENDECTIDSIAQSWAVIAGIGDPARARRALHAVDEQLVKPEEGMILLFTPPFAHTRHDPGYIRSYPAGIRENGGQYTHGVLWTVLAHALLGDGDRAFELWDMLSPIHHAATPARVARYRVEPYVCAADVYSAPDFVGRGGWTWYTGSAAWMYRIAVESMLGLTRRGATLALAPAIPSSWPGYTVTYRFGRTHYRIAVENPAGRSGGVGRIELDGVPVASDAIPLRDDGHDHEVRVVLGDAGAFGARTPSVAPPALPPHKTAA